MIKSLIVWTLLCWGSTAFAADQILAGLQSIRVMYGQVDRDFADQNAALDAIVLALQSAGITATKQSVADPGQYDAGMIISLKCTPAATEGALSGSLLCVLSVEVLALGVNAKGGRGVMTVFHKSADARMAGVDGILQSPMSANIRFLCEAFVTQWKQQNAR